MSGPRCADLRWSAAGSDQAGGAEPGARGLALIVTPASADAGHLGEMLKWEGFRVLAAADGEEAIRRFCAERPAIVFMEVDAPGLDGCEITRAIKRASGAELVPVIFMTGQLDEETLLRCTEVGGDDFLLKPIQRCILKARLLVAERVRDFQNIQRARRRVLTDLLDWEHEEEALAERVLSGAVKNRNVLMDRLGLVQRPAAIFSGDLVLTQHLPDGGLRILLADFTGHGLAAAVAVLPVADAFHAMTRKGVGDVRLLAELNRKLYQLLPADRFMAAILITIPGSGEVFRWWNGGMPSAWLRTATELRELCPHGLPLGILPELPVLDEPRRIRLDPSDRLLLMTDGLLEAEDTQGRMFLHAGLDEVLRDWEHGTSVLPRLFARLDAHCTETPQADDIAALEIPLDPRVLAAPEPEPEVCPDSGWTIALDLEGERLLVQPSLEAALRPLGLMKGLARHRVVLETILAELFANALEHGILKLDSAMKATAAGFDDYYRERAKRLEQGYVGAIAIRITLEPLADGGRVRICVQDSGEGFSPEDARPLGRDFTRLDGRGIPLLQHLCETIEFRGNGSAAEASYRW